MTEFKKPKVKLIGQDGNIFSILGRCGGKLREKGYEDKANEMSERVHKSHSYQEALSVIMEYVEAT